MTRQKHGCCLAISAAALLLSITDQGIAASKGANWLMQEQAKIGCASGQGKFSRYIERDITGDGANDLILDHRDLRCSGASSMSGFCGAQACSVMFYVKRGKLLVLAEEKMSVGVKVNKGKLPKIDLVSHGGKPYSLRWNGKSFR